MTNPLTTLDELIWRQFEKVTIAAEKRWGWDKWDLARIPYGIAAGCTTGFGVYGFVKDVIFSDYYLVPFNTILALAGPVCYVVGNKIMQEGKTYEERRLLQSSATRPPTFDSHRPITLMGGGGFIVDSIYTFTYGAHYIPMQYKSNPESFNILTGLTILLGGFWLASLTTTDYFLSQLPRRPSTAKKSLWQALAGYVIKPFHKEQQPAEVPAAKYAAEQSTTESHPLKSRA